MLTYAACAACRPAHALYFVSYELAKDALGGNEAGPLAIAVTGFMAAIAIHGTMTPSDVMTQQFHVGNSPYRGMTNCILRDSREEGVPAIFNFYSATVGRARSARHAFLKAGYSLLSIPLCDWGLVQDTKTTIRFCSNCHAQCILTVIH